jgi:hypothetical protein
MLPSRAYGLKHTCTAAGVTEEAIHMTSMVAAALAGILVIGTTVGVVRSVNSHTPSRVQSTTVAPAYGSR